MENKLVKSSLMITKGNLTVVRHFHSVPKVFNTPSTSPLALIKNIENIRFSLKQLTEEKKKAELALRESNIKTKEDQKKAIEKLKPKRIGSSFSMFNSLQFNIIKADLIQTGKLEENDPKSFVKVSQEVLARFMALDPKEKELYEKLLKKEKERYEKEMKVYQEAKQNMTKKIPGNYYSQYFKDVCKDIKAELEKTMEKVSAVDCAKVAGKRWKEMDESSKQKYKDEYEKKMVAYRQAKENQDTQP